MSTPILKTKLYIPPSRPTIVSRTRLFEYLDAGLHRKLILVSAPAGFGKTTLLSDWLSTREQPVAWLSLDEGDNDLLRFMMYLIATLQTVEPGIGEAVYEALSSARQHPFESLLTRLLNDIAAVSDPFLLVLDDYHLIDNTQIDDVLRFLLEYLPPQVHLVIATREDPQLSLARLRGRGQLTELRVAELRFTADEAADFLTQVMQLSLSSADIEALEQRTEGWIAGLQLAALSMRGHNDNSAFITAFTGSNRFVLDYLVEEVLRLQPDPIRQFLLQTSILQRLSSALCDAVTSQHNSQQMLETLERGNLFVVSLDTTRQWYRYHHLFAEALHMYLINDHPEIVPALHMRACEWYVQNNLLHDAIEHALAAPDFARAAELIERIWPAMDEAYQSATWVAWVEALPAGIITKRPILNLGYAWALLNRGDLDAAEALLHVAEDWLSNAENDKREIIAFDEEHLKSLPAAIAGARAYKALTLGDIPATKRYARRAIELSSRVEDTSHRQGTSLLGIAYWANGELAAADEMLETFMMNMLKAGNNTDAMVAFILGEIRVARGQLRRSYATYEYLRGVVQTEEPPSPSLPLGAEELYRGLSEYHHERGEVTTAEHYLRIAEAQGQHTTLPNWQHRLSITKANLAVSAGQFDEALRLLDNAASRYTPAPLGTVQPIAAMKARVWIRQGTLVKAEAWAREHNLTATDTLSYYHEFEHITLARLYLAQIQRGDDALEPAMQLLKRLEQSAQAGERSGILIEILILQALAHQAANNLELALSPLQHALELAAPEGYVRVFVVEGDRMAELLAVAAQRGIASDYVRHLQGMFPQSAHDSPVRATQDLIEPLSDRELDVLRLLDTELTGPEIAHELTISLNTMRTHTKHIYSKLGVNSRRAAVRRAHDIGLL